MWGKVVEKGKILVEVEVEVNVEEKGRSRTGL